MVKNYRVVKQLDGSWLASYMTQDGWEREVCDTREDAVAACKRGARIMNGVKIKKKDISFGETFRIVSEEIIWK